MLKLLFAIFKVYGISNKFQMFDTRKNWEKIVEYGFLKEKYFIVSIL